MARVGERFVQGDLLSQASLSMLLLSRAQGPRPDIAPGLDEALVYDELNHGLSACVRLPVWFLR